MASAPAFRSEEVLARIGRALGPVFPQRVLDLACGPGIVAEALASRADAWVGVDATPRMLELARERLARAGQHHAVFLEAPADALGLPGASFDAALARLAFHHFPNLPAVLAELRRVLRPRGRLVVADVVAVEDPVEARLHNALERLRDPTHVRMLAPLELRASLEAAGFDIVSEERWEQPREFAEWAAIAADPARTEPLREVMVALARAGLRAGIELQECEGELRFRHRWLLIAAVARPASGE